jgi:hypothetical protein
MRQSASGNYTMQSRMQTHTDSSKATSIKHAVPLRRLRSTGQAGSTKKRSTRAPTQCSLRPSITSTHESSLSQRTGSVHGILLSVS